MTQASKLLCALVVSALTTFAAALTLSWLHLETTHDPYRSEYWLSIPGIPILPFICGLVAGTGTYLAYKALHIRPSRYTAALAFITALATYVLQRYLFFKMLFPLPLLFDIDFSEFLKSVTSGASAEEVRSGSWTMVDNLRYYRGLIPVGAFFLGGILMQKLLTSEPWCPNCNLYLRKQGSTSSRYNSEQRYSMTWAEVLKQIKRRSAAKAMMTLREDANWTEPAKHVLHGVLHQCPGCHIEHMTIQGQTKQGRRWVNDKRTPSHLQQKEGLIPASASLQS